MFIENSNMSSCKFAIAILTRNRLGYFQEMLFSVINQSFVNFDIYIIDSFSSDGTQSYCSKLVDDRIKYVRINQDLPASNSFKVALEHCSPYSFFSIVHDDDILEPTYIEEGLRLFNNYSDLGFVSFNANYFNNSFFQKKLLYRKIDGFEIIKKGEGLIQNILNSDTLMFPSIMYRGKLGLKDYLNREDCSVGDFLFYNEISNHFDVAIIYKPLYNYRRHFFQHSNGIPYFDLKILENYIKVKSSNNKKNANFLFNRNLSFYRSRLNIRLYRRVYIVNLLLIKYKLNNISFSNFIRMFLFILNK